MVKKVRVLVVDDHRVLADLVTKSIAEHPRLEAVGVAFDVGHAQALLAATSPDVILLDERIPGGGGLALCQALVTEFPDAASRPKVVILTGHPRPDLQQKSFTLGVNGYFGKDADLAELFDVIADLQTSDRVTDSRLNLRWQGGDSALKLTPRELDVLGLLGEGLDVAEISAKLSLSVHTTRVHVKSILNRLEVRTQLQAVIKAGQLGLIQVGGLWVDQAVEGRP